MSNFFFCTDDDLDYSDEDISNDDPYQFPTFPPSPTVDPDKDTDEDVLFLFDDEDDES